MTAASSAFGQAASTPAPPNSTPQSLKLQEGRPALEAPLAIPQVEEEETDLPGTQYDQEITLSRVLLCVPAPVGAADGGCGAGRMPAVAGTAVPFDRLQQVFAADECREGKCPGVKLRRLFEIRHALQTLYRNQGHFLARVILERQPVERQNAVVRYQLFEGRITHVLLQGDVGPVRALLERMGQRLVTERPATLAEVERQLLLIQDVPGIAVRAHFAPSPTPGGSMLTIDVARTATAGFASIDSRGAPFAGPWQGSIGLSANSFTALGERTELYLYSTPGREQRFGQVALSSVLTADGLGLRLQAGHGPSYPGGLLGQAGFASDVTTAGLQFTLPMLRSRAANLWLQSGLTLHDSNIRLEQAGGGYERITRSHLRIVNLSVRSSLVDGWNGVTQFWLGIDQGLEGLGATPRDDALTARPDSRPDFTRATARVSSRRALFPTTTADGPWRFDLEVSVGGQYGIGVLPPSQKAQLGGLEYGRGYYYGQLTGDRALAGSLELSATRPLADWLAGSAVTPYLFYDHGMVWNLATGDPGRRFLHSAGGGIRLDLGRHLTGELELAGRLVRNPSRTNEAPLAPTRMSARLTARY